MNVLPSALFPRHSLLITCRCSQTGPVCAVLPVTQPAYYLGIRDAFGKRQKQQANVEEHARVPLNNSTDLVCRLNLQLLRLNSPLPSASDVDLIIGMRGVLIGCLNRGAVHLLNLSIWAFISGANPLAKAILPSVVSVRSHTMTVGLWRSRKSKLKAFFSSHLKLDSHLTLRWHYCMNKASLRTYFNLVKPIFTLFHPQGMCCTNLKDE